ncbi:MAG: B12-binding domain-containing radical SAM protein [Anaerolineae bacterium]|nr:B12-binding domain-containing radical SAM protein [Anaerolineae bacterium]
MKKIILYNPQSSATKKPIMPLSLLAVGAVLEEKYDYQIIDGNLEVDALARLDAVISECESPPIVAVTVMPGPQLQQAVSLCRELKRRHPHMTMIWGGYFPTQHWDSCLRSDFVDYVVRGHGEVVFRQLLDALTTGQPQLKAIAGVAYRDEAGEPVSTMEAPIPNPAQLPMMNFDRVPVERYVRPTFMGTRTLGYHSSYGCPFFCNFCAVVNMVNGRWLPQTAAQVAGVVETYHRRWGVNAVEFFDNNFFTHHQRVAEFSERIMPLGVSWWGEGRIDTMLKFSTRTWQLMRDSGLRMVFLGAESGSMETLKRMDKGGKMSPEKTLEMARMMKDWNIVPEFSFVMGNPPDPETDMHETMEFIRRVKAVNPASEIIMYLYSPVPLSGELYEQAKADGFAFPETLEEWISPEWLNFSQRRSHTMPWIKQTLQQQILDFERVLNAYYPTTTDIKLTQTWRGVLRLVSAARYHSRFYRFPVELRALHRLIAYQRPETSGF